MAERFTRVFSQSGQFYCPGAPVIIQAGALLKDNQTGNIIAQVKFKNISPKAIKALFVKIYAKDISGADIEGVDNFQYLDLNVRRDKEFGSKTPIALPNAVARSFSCECLSAIFSDGTTWVCDDDAQWSELPAPTALEKVISNALIEQFERDTGLYSNCTVTDHQDLWYCTCGAINRSEEDACHYCQAKKADLLAALNTDTLTANKDKYDAEVEANKKKRDAEIAAQRAAEEEAARTRAKKAKKIASITVPIVCVIIAFIIVLNAFIIPNSKYNQAIALIDNGEIVKAYDALIALDGYKDSAEKADSIFDKYKIEKIKTAKCGDHIFFGTYEQDNNISNGKEDIEWIVLSAHEGRVMVISKYVLDCKPYNEKFMPVSWEQCSLRTWLNADFLDSAFSTIEKSFIPTVTVEAFNHEGKHGEETQDQVFILHPKELDVINQHQVVLSQSECEPTKFAISNGVSTDYDGRCLWWQRETDPYAKINLFGWDYTYYYWQADSYTNINSANIGVRPALWIDWSGAE